MAHPEQTTHTVSIHNDPAPSDDIAPWHLVSKCAHPISPVTEQKRTILFNHISLLNQFVFVCCTPCIALIKAFPLGPKQRLLLLPLLIGTSSQHVISDHDKQHLIEGQYARSCAQPLVQTAGKRHNLGGGVLQTNIHMHNSQRIRTCISRTNT